jgi:hypothetical protein
MSDPVCRVEHVDDDRSRVVVNDWTVAIIDRWSGKGWSLTDLGGHRLTENYYLTPTDAARTVFRVEG